MHNIILIQTEISVYVYNQKFEYLCLRSDRLPNNEEIKI